MNNIFHNFHVVGIFFYSLVCNLLDRSKHLTLHSYLSGQRCSVFVGAVSSVREGSPARSAFLYSYMDMMKGAHVNWWLLE